MRLDTDQPSLPNILEWCFTIRLFGFMKLSLGWVVSQKKLLHCDKRNKCWCLNVNELTNSTNAVMLFGFLIW